MELKVFWTDAAIEKLEDIFDYYKNRVSVDIAISVVDAIINSTIRLETQSVIGPIEELLKDREFEYRFLIIDNYKIIYWIEEPYIKIATVFDCRQNPIKIKKI